MKRARVYRRGTRLFFHAVSHTPEGLWVMAAPFVAVEDGAAETFFGETLQRVLEASRLGGRDATEAGRGQFLRSTRTRTWSLFVRTAWLCDIDKDSAGVRFFPTRSGGRRVFEPTAPPVVTLGPRALSIELGAALEKAFASLEPRRRRAS